MTKRKIKPNEDRLRAFAAAIQALDLDDLCYITTCMSWHIKNDGFSTGVNLFYAMLAFPADIAARRGLND